jgi:uracil-DNA glycosylase
MSAGPCRIVRRGAEDAQTRPAPLGGGLQRLRRMIAGRAPEMAHQDTRAPQGQPAGPAAHRVP